MTNFLKKEKNVQNNSNKKENNRKLHINCSIYLFAVFMKRLANIVKIWYNYKYNRQLQEEIKYVEYS